jgi:hypothetical protein
MAPHRQHHLLKIHEKDNTFNISLIALAKADGASLGQKKSLGRPDDRRLARRRWSSTKAADESAARHARDTLRKRHADLAGR